MMSARRTDTSSKRKRTPPQKLKSRKIFAASRRDVRELSPHMSRDEDDQENYEMLHNRENVPKSLQNKKTQKENMTETPQNKENMPGKYPSGAVPAHRGRGRPKGSKNKTFPAPPTRVYAVREGKSPVYTEKITRDSDTKPQNGQGTPHRGRGRPKGSTKVKQIDQDGPKRSRGRPKGSKNRKPSKASLMKVIPEVQKMARGRPRKTPETADPDRPKKPGRGRPKGSLNKIPSARKLALLAAMHEVKKRGRPKKIKLDSDGEMSLTVKVKRPRGRPKSTASYVHVSNIELESSASNTRDGEEEEEDDDDDDDDDL